MRDEEAHPLRRVRPRAGREDFDLAEGDVLIEDERIAEVGRGLRARDAEVVDATNTIVMPGFVDTHRMAAESRDHVIAKSGFRLPGI